MKVLHINRNYLTSPLHQVMMRHLNNLEEIDSHVFAPTDSASEAVIKPDENVYVSECFKKRDRLIFDLKQKKIIKAIENAYDLDEFSCIHAYTLFTDGNSAMVLSKKYSIPYIVAVRNTDVNDFFKKLPFMRKRGIEILKHASVICFLSETYRKEVFNKYIPLKLHDYLLKKTCIIPNGIDDFWLKNQFTEKRLIHNPLKLIYAGRIDNNKNIETTLKAMKVLENKGYSSQLTVVGGISDNKLFKRISQNPHLIYKQAVPKEKLIEIYRDNDIFVMPSHTESFGLVYAEALSQGLPVIYTKGQGFDGQFAEGKIGYHVNDLDPSDISEKILNVIKQFERLTNNINGVCEKFSWDDIAKKYYTIYNIVGR